MSLGGSSPYTSTNITNKNKYTWKKQYKKHSTNNTKHRNTSIQITKTPTHQNTHKECKINLWSHCSFPVAILFFDLVLINLKFLNYFLITYLCAALYNKVISQIKWDVLLCQWFWYNADLLVTAHQYNLFVLVEPPVSVLRPSS